MVSKVKINIKPDEQFHKIPIEDLFVDLNSSAQGLTTEQAETQRKQYGRNDITSSKKQSPILQFFEQFTNPLVLILLFAAIISIVVHEITNATIIISIILISVILDFFQRYKAESAAESRIKKIVTRAKAHRDRKENEILIFDLVPDDVISLLLVP